MIETLSIREMESKADNIYEAIMVLSRRARQINDEQKQLISSEKEYDDEYDEMGDEEFSLAINDSFLKLPKPIEVSLEEFQNDKLRHDYAKPSTDDGDAS